MLAYAVKSKVVLGTELTNILRKGMACSDHSPLLALHSLYPSLFVGDVDSSGQEALL